MIHLRTSGKGRVGFTFVELLCVMVIIAVLVAMLLPMFARSRRRARQVACVSNLKQLGMALQLYSLNHDGRYPPQDHEWAPTMPHVKNLAVFRCPDDPAWRRGGVLSRWGAGRSSETQERIFSSYTYRGGYSNDDWADTRLASEWESFHRGWRNVLYLDGRVEAIHRSKWKQMAPGQRPLPYEGDAP